MSKWVLVMRWHPNEVLTSAGAIWVQNEKQACFDIKDAKIFESESAADQFKKDIGGNLIYFEPEKSKVYFTVKCKM